MQTLTKILLSALMILSLGAASSSADVSKGKKLFTKKLKNVCGITGQAMAHKHTQAEWKKIHEKGNISKEIKEICPNVKDNAIKEKYSEHYFDFLHEFASDSGNIPSC